MQIAAGDFLGAAAWSLDAQWMDSAQFPKVEGGGDIKARVTQSDGTNSHWVRNLLRVALSCHVIVDPACAPPYPLALNTERCSNPTSNCQYLTSA